MKKYLCILGLGVLLWSCKPTEKNYEAAYSKAYEAARLKSEAERTGENGVKLESIDGPSVQTVGTDSVTVGRGRLRPFEADSLAGEGNYGIAIAKYSMATNARRHLQDVKAEYPDAFIATDGKDGYYVMIKRVESIPEAADPVRVYRLSHPADSYIGLDGSPMVYFVSIK